MILPGKRRWPCCSAKSQAATTAKLGLTNSEGCSERPGQIDPAPGALDLAAGDEGDGGQRQRDQKPDHRDAPDAQRTAAARPRT